MSIQSSYPDHKCGKCGINIKKGDAINKIDVTGQWCSNENCPNPPKTEAAATQSTGIENAAFIEAETKKIMDIEKVVLATVPEETKKNGQKVGMYVKEIYKQLKKKERNSS